MAFHLEASLTCTVSDSQSQTLLGALAGVSTFSWPSPQWLEEARIAEKHEPPMLGTCRAIVGAIVGRGVESEDRETTWVGDADEAAKVGAVETAR